MHQACNNDAELMLEGITVLRKGHVIILLSLYPPSERSETGEILCDHVCL